MACGISRHDVSISLKRKGEGIKSENMHGEEGGGAYTRSVQTQRWEQADDVQQGPIERTKWLLRRESGGQPQG